MTANFKFRNVLWAVSLISILSSCANYYKATVARVGNNIEKATAIDSLNNERRYLILRNNEKAFCMNNIAVSEDKKTLECTLDTLAVCNKLHLTLGRKGKMRYRKSNAADLAVLNEAHVYIDPDSSASLGKYQLKLGNVKKIEVIEKDKKRTTGSYVAGGLGITLSIVAILFVIIAASTTRISLLGP